MESKNVFFFVARIAMEHGSLENDGHLFFKSLISWVSISQEQTDFHMMISWRIFDATRWPRHQV